MSFRTHFFSQPLLSFWTRMHENNWNFPPAGISLTSHAHNQAGCCSFTSSEFKNRPEVSTVILSDMSTVVCMWVIYSVLFIWNNLFTILLKEPCHEDCRQTGPTAWIKTFGECFFDVHAVASLVVATWVWIDGFNAQTNLSIHVAYANDWRVFRSGAHPGSGVDQVSKWCMMSDKKCINKDKESKHLFSRSKVVSENALQGHSCSTSCRSARSSSPHPTHHQLIH